MDHRAIPQLLTQLTQMKPWPTQIIRAQMVWENPNSDLRRSTNTNRNRGPAGQFDPADAGGGRRDFLTSALADPYLAHVVVAGLMTIYLPPANEMAAQPGAAEKPAAPAETATPEADPLAGSEPREAAPNESGLPTTPPDATAIGTVPAPESAEAPTTESDPTPSTDPVPDSEPANGTEPATDSEPAADSEAAEDAAASDENTNTPVSEPEGNP